MEVCTFDANSSHAIRLPPILTLALLASKPGRRGRQKKAVVEEAAPESDAAGGDDQVKDTNNDCKNHLPTMFYSTNVQEADSDATMKEEKSEDSDQKPVFK